MSNTRSSPVPAAAQQATGATPGAVPATDAEVIGRSRAGPELFAAIFDRHSAVQPGWQHPAPTSPPLAVPATASAVFLLAARAAAATPDLKPRLGQFIYVKQRIVGEVYTTKHSTRVIHVPPSQQRTWLSADGRRGLPQVRADVPDGGEGAGNPPCPRRGRCGGAAGYRGRGVRARRDQQRFHTWLPRLPGAERAHL